MTQLGKKLNNPYSVANMKKALESIKLPNATARAYGSVGNIEVKLTHYYVKFIPKTEEELDILKSDTTLELFDYPLDYEIANMGSYYHDPKVPSDQPTPQYTAVPKDYIFPQGVDYEILEDLFLPEEEDDVQENSTVREKAIGGGTIDSLITKSLELTGNLEENEKYMDEKARYRRRKWRPVGRIRVWDNHAGYTITTRRVFSHWEYYPCGGDRDFEKLRFEDDGMCRRAVYRTITHRTPGSYVPVAHVKVRARRWFWFSKAYTNAQGYFSGHRRFRRPANYSIKWERRHFSVRSGTFGQAIYNGPKIKGNWNVDIGRHYVIGGFAVVSNMQQYYALIFQAAYDYYSRNVFGIHSPPLNSFWKPQTKISASQTPRQHNKDSHAAHYARTGGQFPTVYIREWNRPSDRIYGVTIHELAHLAHFNLHRDAYRYAGLRGYSFSGIIVNQYSALLESWAQGVEWVFTTHRYRNYYGVAGFNYPTYRSNTYNYQTQLAAGFTTNIDPQLAYTSIVIDLMDNENQRITRGPGRPIDRVHGYTIAEIENGLRGAKTWNQFRNNLRDRVQNPTEHYLNELFANWW